MSFNLGPEVNVQFTPALARARFMGYAISGMYCMQAYGRISIDSSSSSSCKSSSVLYGRARKRFLTSVSGGSVCFGRRSLLFGLVLFFAVGGTYASAIFFSLARSCPLSS